MEKVKQTLKKHGIPFDAVHKTYNATTFMPGVKIVHNGTETALRMDDIQDIASGFKQYDPATRRVELKNEYRFL